MSLLKKYFIVVYCIMFSLTPCFAENDTGFRNMYKRNFVSSCIENSQKNYATSHLQFPIQDVTKVCICVADKVLNKYSVADLIEIESFNGKINEFMGDIQNFNKECLINI